MAARRSECMPLFFKFNDVVAALFHAIYRQLTGTPSPIATPIPSSVFSSFESLNLPCQCPPYNNRRSFISSSARPASEEPESQNISSEDWENLSSQAKLKSIEGDRKWGWVIYRCSYAKEWEPTWESVKLSIIEDLRREIAESDTPSIADTMEFIFIEDPSLEGASIEQLQHRFQAWAEAHPAYVYYEGSRSRATRFNFFLKADAELMRRGDLGLVQGWPYEPGEEDWIRIDDGDVSTHLYVELDNTEMWYIYYTEPSGYAHIQ